MPGPSWPACGLPAGLEDTPGFVAGRIDYAWRRYTDGLLPPFFRQLVEFTDSHEYSWHTPGHAGGTAFRKSQVGRAFYDFYGETLIRTDLSVSVAELGSLLDHSGAVQAAEANAARVFGADQTYFVLNGTSTSNRIIAHSCVTAGDIVLADRNCHESVNYALTMTDAIPVYPVPSRNAYGIIGPVPRAQLSAEAIAGSAARSPLARGACDQAPVYAVITNSTYDGLCYRADQVTGLLGDSAPRAHFDEAWFAYARFHPLYRGRYAMHDREAAPGDPTIYATQSTHKLLAGPSEPPAGMVPRVYAQLRPDYGITGRLPQPRQRGRRYWLTGKGDRQGRQDSFPGGHPQGAAATDYRRRISRIRRTSFLPASRARQTAATGAVRSSYIISSLFLVPSGCFSCASVCAGALWPMQGRTSAPPGAGP